LRLGWFFLPLSLGEAEEASPLGDRAETGGRRRSVMKVVAINSSPMMGKGNTALILTPFLAGMEKAGAEVRLFHTMKLEIRPCQGEFHCWTRHPGECFQDDDVGDLLEEMKGAEVWVFASPVFVDGISGPLKTLLDRMIPLIQPYVEMRDDHSRHPLRDGTKRGKVALVSNCGFWELDNFDPLLVHMEAMCKNTHREFAGALLRPHGPALRVMRDQGEPVGDVFEAAERAGRELVEQGRMGAEVLKTVSRELLPRDIYTEQLNRNFQAAIAKWDERRTKATSGRAP
jgi:multimeric flavodoxin WrbA